MKSLIGHTLEAIIGASRCGFVFSHLEGSPEAGDLQMDLVFRVGTAVYTYRGDGWQFAATRNGEPVDVEFEPIPGLSIDVIAGELALAYVRDLATNPDRIFDWLDGSWVLNVQGQLEPAPPYSFRLPKEKP